MTKKTRFRYLRILLYYKYWLAVDKIARRFNYTPRYVQKVLYRSDMKPYACRLTNGFYLQSKTAIYRYNWLNAERKISRRNTETNRGWMRS